jgi:chromosome segregation ATPase
MATPKKIIIKDLELADEEIARLRKENKELKEKVDTLELCIKNKDELLEEYRKKIDKLRTDNIYEE